MSVAPGETIRFYVAELGAAQSFGAELVQVFCAHNDPLGPGQIEIPVDTPFSGTHRVRPQATYPGSFVEIDAAEPFRRLRNFSAAAFVWTAVPQRGDQSLLATRADDDACGWSLDLDSLGCLALSLWTRDRELIRVQASKSLPARHWAFVAVAVDVDRATATLIQMPLKDYARKIHGFVVSRPLVAESSATGWGGGPLRFAARNLKERAHRASAGCFDGKIERPMIFGNPLEPGQLLQLCDHEPSELGLLPMGHWDFAQGVASRKAVDVSGHGRHGHCRQLPQRAVTGRKWSGRRHSFEQVPAEYGAIWFHSNDLYDCEWEESFAWTVPARMQSGVYAVKLSDGNLPGYIVFAVRPPRHEAHSPVVYLMSTANYLAYANWGLFDRRPYFEAARGRLIQAGPEDVTLFEHPQFGRSAYDYHPDGSGIKYTSWLRPILNLRPNTRLTGFAGDSFILAWLHTLGIEPDVITDHDLHQDGATLLRRYRVMVTGCHAEYWSTAMIDALKGFLAQGGRLMSLGANAFYWRIALSSEWPAAIEVRRGQGGSGAWKGEPGEDHCAFTGEMGGLWRHNGTTPQELAGVGMTAMGFDYAVAFHRREGSDHPRAAFIFNGVTERVIGDFGIGFGGAAGQELDRFDLELGSPPHALVLATSAGHSDHILGCLEDMANTSLSAGGTENPQVRADMVFFETASGGAVFSSGSISWASALPINGFRNNVAQITTNVLKRFMSGESFALPTPE